MTLYIPPLRERRDEIEPLARLFVAEYSARAGHRPPRIEPSAMGWLVRQPWPGNIRELRKVVERAVMLSGALGPEAQNATITTEHLAEPASAPWSDLPVPSDLKGELASLERTRIEEALARAGGNQKKAAELLGISRRTLIGRLDAYGLPRPRKSVPR